MQRILIIGASRGIGHAMAEDLVTRGWHVTGTVRGSRETPLHALRAEQPEAVEIASLDITEPAQIAALHDQLRDRRFDILLVNAGTANANQDETIAETSTEEFTRVMVTNALSPMRVVEALAYLVTPEGTICVMSSGQGQRRREHPWRPRGLSRLEGGAEPVHAQLCGPRRGNPADAADGAGLDPDRAGREERTLHAGGIDTQARERSAGAEGQAGPALRGSRRPDGRMVTP